MRVASVSCPELAATSSAVNPCSVTASRSHPAEQRHLTSSEWPYLAARWRGVAPFCGVRSRGCVEIMQVFIFLARLGYDLHNTYAASIGMSSGNI